MLWAELCPLPPKDVKVLLVPHNVTLLGNKVVAEVSVKRKSYWNRVGHVPRLTGLLIKRDTQGEYHIKMEARTGVMSEV